MPADGELFPVTLEEQIAEVEREIAMRRQVYPRQVASGRMKQGVAERRIATMEAILMMLQALKVAASSSPIENAKIAR